MNRWGSRAHSELLPWPCRIPTWAPKRPRCLQDTSTALRRATALLRATRRPGTRRGPRRAPSWPPCWRRSRFTGSARVPPRCSPRCCRGRTPGASRGLPPSRSREGRAGRAAQCSARSPHSRTRASSCAAALRFAPVALAASRTPTSSRPSSRCRRCRAPSRPAHRVLVVLDQRRDRRVHLPQLSLYAARPTTPCPRRDRRVHLPRRPQLSRCTSSTSPGP